MWLQISMLLISIPVAWTGFGVQGGGVAIIPTPPPEDTFGVDGEATAKPRIPTNDVLCKYGLLFKRDCCYGWKRVGRRCLPICNNDCVHGTCVGPNTCQCDKGYTGPSCNQDYNECGDMPWRCPQRCMNTLGSYKCYCDYGYILQEDKYTCSRDNRCDTYRCAVGCEQYSDGFRCICPDGLRVAPNGLSCIDIDECKEGLVQCPQDRVCRNTFGNYFCSCPDGLSFNYNVINGRKQLVCRDANECDGPNDCDVNAICINQSPGYKCECKVGYGGDGTVCTELDTRTCDDGPCFDGVECVDTGPDPGNPFGKLFICRSCPTGYVGDGIDCLNVEQTLIVIVEDKTSPGVPVNEARVSVMTVSDDSSGATELHEQKYTSNNGIAELSAPNDKPFIITVSKTTYFDNSRTYNIVPGKNVVTFVLDGTDSAQTEDVEYKDDRETSVEFDFGDQRGDLFGQDGVYSVIIPAGSLAVADGTILSVSLKGIDVRDDESLAQAPELVGSVSDGLWPLESYGMVELSIVEKSGQQDVVILSEIILEIPLNAIPNSLEEGDIVGAYYYDSDAGLWIKDGDGTIATNIYGDQLWRYSVKHLTWWNADRAVYDSNCVSVTTCYDADCNQRAGNTVVTISGNDYFYTTSKVTDENGKACFNYKQGGTTLISAPCSGHQELVTGTSEYSVCPAELGGSGVYNTRYTDRNDCQQVTFFLFGITKDCEDPGPLGNGIRIGNELSIGSNVTFFCDPDYYLGAGSSRRVCHGCGDWSGSQPHCFPSDYESSGSSSSYNYYFPL